MSTGQDAAADRVKKSPAGGQRVGTWAAVASTREPVAQRIMLTLEACAAKKRALTIVELVNETGLAKTTVHRMCWKLVELGLLEHSDEGFSVGSKLFALANANPAINELRVAAIPYLIELQRRTGAMPNLAILSGRKSLILDGLFTRESARSPRLIGFSLPLHCTGVGKAIAARLDPEQRELLLFGDRGGLPAAAKRTITSPAQLRAHLERASQAGVAVADEEFLPGIKSVAAGFRLRGGGVAAIGCVEAWNSPTLRHAPRAVTAAASALERTLSGH
ncbi:MAG TPA: IclR family transcriptional regulator [Amycolatopsis sp.]|nr:IclR family transcriptional regulator [Amycolatopsis sp.]